MPNFRRLLSRRRLLAVLGVAALLFGLLMLHPYPRQSLFGPTIRGKPWCVWEDALLRYRDQVNGKERLTFNIQQWLGIEPEEMEDADLFDDAEMLPLVLQFAEDSDRDVRATTFEIIRRSEKLHDKSILPVLHRRLRQDDQENRLRVAWLIWCIDKDKSVIPVFLRDMENRPIFDADGEAVRLLGCMCDGAPELIPLMGKFAEDPDFSISNHALNTGNRLRKRGVPILTRCLENKRHYVRCMACEYLGALGAEARDAIGSVQRAKLAEPDKTKQWHYDWTLHRIDREQFAYPRDDEQKLMK